MEIDRDETARTIIEYRWHYKDWLAIAGRVGSTTKTLRELRLSESYENQVWATYGRSSWIFNKHTTYENCISHLTNFFGITRRLATEVLANDWREPEVKATQLEIAI